MHWLVAEGDIAIEELIHLHFEKLMTKVREQCSN